MTSSSPSKAAGGLWRWLHESRNSELVVVFGEDFAALVGLIIAFAFVALTMAAPPANLREFIAQQLQESTFGTESLAV